MTTVQDDEGYADSNRQSAYEDGAIKDFVAHGDHAVEGVDAEGHAIDAGQRVEEYGKMMEGEGDALKNHGDGFGEELEHEFKGDGTVTGELGEMGAAVGGELLEGASEAGTAIVGATMHAAGEIVEGVGKGIHEGEDAVSHLMDGDVDAAGASAVDAVKDIAGGVLEGAEIELKGAAEMIGELVEGAGAVGWEIGEGIVEVGGAIADSEAGQAIGEFAGDVYDGAADVAGDVYDTGASVVSGVGEGLEDAWDFLTGDDEPAAEDEEPAAVEEEASEESDDDSWF